MSQKCDAKILILRFRSIRYIGLWCQLHCDQPNQSWMGRGLPDLSPTNIGTSVARAGTSSQPGFHGSTPSVLCWLAVVWHPGRRSRR